jgi:hypothetical protein
VPSRSVEEIAPEFRPRAPVSWSDPVVLARSGFAAGMTALMRGYSDRRVTQAALFPPADGWDTPVAELREHDPYWFDFVADIGDGFDATYAVAYALAEPALRLAETDCPRGQLLLLGGDEVYPTPSQTQYLDRTLRPYALAEHTDDVDSTLDVLAIPGNHDWYDGLDAFSELFSPGHWLGARTMNQRHSYFARQLPHGWWVLGADTALSGRLDFAQKDFFATVVAPKIGPTDSVILVLPSPFWVTAARSGDQEQLAVLRFFRDQVCSGGRLRLCVSGDLHHYSRYVDEAEDPAQQVQYVTAGGGGAYLLSTHDLWRFWPRLDLAGSFRRTRKRRPQWTPTLTEAERTAPPGAENATLLNTYPDRRTSRNLSVQVLWRMFTNWPMGLFFCGIYLLATLVEGHALRAASAFHASMGEVLARVTPLCPPSMDGCPPPRPGAGPAYGVLEFAEALATSPGVWIIVVILLVCCFSVPADTRMPVRLGLTIGHAVLQSAAFFAVQGVFLWLAGMVAPHAAGGAFVALYLIWVTVAGYVAGLGCCAIYLLTATGAGANYNELFCAMRLPTYKNFLRLRIDADGVLTVFPVRIDKPASFRLLPGGRLPDNAFDNYSVETGLIEEPYQVLPNRG